MAALAGCGSAAPAPPSAVGAPLEAVVAAPGSVWATAPMGILSHQATTFWQVFGRKGSRWVLATPPGIATNGGLVVAPGPSTAVAAAVLPSGNLHFSPVQARASAVAPWSSGALPAGIIRSPDALATSTVGRRLAVVTTSGGTLMQSPGALSSWRALASLRQVSRGTASEGCRFAALDAVGFSPGGIPVVAGRCATGGVLPIAWRDGGSWRLVKAASSFQDGDVLRLAVERVGAAALVAVGPPGHRRVVVARGGGELSVWTTTAPLVLPASSTIVSTSLEAGGQAIVVLSLSDRARVAYAWTGPGTRWSTLPRLPEGTVDVAPGATGSYQALVVRGAALLVFESVGGEWRLGQRLVVPISIGSSQ